MPSIYLGRQSRAIRIFVLAYCRASQGARYAFTG